MPLSSAYSRGGPMLFGINGSDEYGRSRKSCRTRGPAEGTLPQDCPAAAQGPTGLRRMRGVESP